MGNATQVVDDVGRGAVAAADHEFAAWMAGAPEEVARANRKLQGILDRESIRFDTKRLPATIKPHCVSIADDRAAGAASEATLAAIAALGQVLCKDDAALALMGFDAPARALLQLEPSDVIMPMCARADALWAADRLSFVEMNTDSPGMALFSDVLQRAVLEVLEEAGLRFASALRGQARTERIMDALVRRYRAAGGDKGDPMVAIVDLPGVMTSAEQARLATQLRARGCRADLFGPGELSYRDGRLYGRDVEIDVVHRRILFPECLARPDEVRPMLRAVRDGNVVMANPLRSYLAGNKAILALAHDPEFAGRLPQAQQDVLKRYVPHSILVDDGARAMLARADRREWVIKSSFGSRGAEVALGPVLDEAQWAAAIERTTSRSWIAQRAVEIPLLGLPVPDGMGWTTIPFFTNWNPWLIDGAYTGATVRCSLAQVISISVRGALAASFALAE